MSEVKKAPDRKCVGCGEMKPKASLIRIVRSKEGDVFIDPTNKANGRGAYICRNAECLKKAQKSKRIERSFECAIPDEIFEAMERELKENEQ